MFEQDYLMRIIAQLLGAIRRSMERAAGEEDPDGAARALDMALGDATNLDGEALLSLPNRWPRCCRCRGSTRTLRSTSPAASCSPAATTVRRDVRIWPSSGVPRVALSPPPSGMSWDPTPSAMRPWRRL